MLIVLVGARGAGKTTLLNSLKAEGVHVLQPSTTRKPRSKGDTEYDHVTQWAEPEYAWGIPVREHTYGMRKSELGKAKTDTCITVFDPLNLQVFEAVRPTLGVETMTVGLATIADVAEQRQRVGNDSTRVMDDAGLASVELAVSQCDVVLTGNAQTVADAMFAMLAMLSGRGGVVTKDHLLPLMKAGALLTDADTTKVRSASYDLRIGPEVLCQGKVFELTDASPRFEIPPYSYAVVSALEHASLPPFVVGRFDLKVSYFFEGVILSNGPQVDPGYKGALFCMLYNGSGRPKLLTLGKHFATLDFTTTTSVTEGYKQKYQLKQRMGQFLTDQSVTGKGGAIVELVEQKVSVVDKKVKGIQRNFWTIAAAVIAFVAVVPALVVPVAWQEISAAHAERAAYEDNQRRLSELLTRAKSDEAEVTRLLEQARAELARVRALPSRTSGNPLHS